MWPPHPSPLPRSGVCFESGVDCGGEGAGTGLSPSLGEHMPHLFLLRRGAFAAEFILLRCLQPPIDPLGVNKPPQQPV